MPRGTTAASAMLAAALAAGALSACGSSSHRSSGGSPHRTPATSASSATAAPVASTTPAASAPALTQPGTTLKLGQTATVRWDNGNPPEYTFAIRVSSITPGSMADFKNASLTGVPKGATPTYVRLTITNVGSKPLKTSVGDPAYSMGAQGSDGLDDDVSMTGDFPPCPQVDSPAEYLPGKSFTTCQIYMERGAVTQIGYDGSSSTIDTPILWSAP